MVAFNDAPERNTVKIPNPFLTPADAWLPHPQKIKAPASVKYIGVSLRDRATGREYMTWLTTWN